MNDNDFNTRPSITDENLIAAAMKYLQYHDPANATRENAISLLAFMQTIAKELSTTMSEMDFDSHYEAYKAQGPEV